MVCIWFMCGKMSPLKSSRRRRGEKSLPASAKRQYTIWDTRLMQWRNRCNSLKWTNGSMRFGTRLQSSNKCFTFFAGDGYCKQTSSGRCAIHIFHISTDTPAEPNFLQRGSTFHVGAGFFVCFASSDGDGARAIVIFNRSKLIIATATHTVFQVHVRVFEDPTVYKSSLRYISTPSSS